MILVKLAEANPQPGDIFLSGPKTRDVFRILFTDLPQGMERKSHAAIYVGNGEIVESWFGRGTYSVPFDVWKKNRDFHIYRVTGGNGQRAANIAKTLRGKDYDALMATRARLLPREWSKIPQKTLKSTPGLFCSTVITIAYPEVAKSLNKHPYDILPVDLPRSPLLKRVK